MEEISKDVSTKEELDQSETPQIKTGESLHGKRQSTLKTNIPTPAQKLTRSSSTLSSITPRSISSQSTPNDKKFNLLSQIQIKKKSFQQERRKLDAIQTAVATSYDSLTALQKKLNKINGKPEDFGIDKLKWISFERLNDFKHDFKDACGDEGEVGTGTGIARIFLKKLIELLSSQSFSNEINDKIENLKKVLDPESKFESFDEVMNLALNILSQVLSQQTSTKHNADKLLEEEKNRSQEFERKFNKLLSVELDSSDDRFEKLQQFAQSLTEELAQRDEILVEKTIENEKLNELIKARDEFIKSLDGYQTQIKILEAENLKLKNELDSDKKYDDENNLTETQQTKIDQSEILQLKEKLSKYEDDLKNYSDENSINIKLLETRTQVINSLQEKEKSYLAKINELTVKVKDLKHQFNKQQEIQENELKDLYSKIGEKNLKIRSMNEDFERFEKCNYRLQKNRVHLEYNLNKLQEKNNRLMEFIHLLKK